MFLYLVTGVVEEGEEDGQRGRLFTSISISRRQCGIITKALYVHFFLSTYVYCGQISFFISQLPSFLDISKDNEC